MKIIACILIAAFASHAAADQRTCSAYVGNNPKMVRAIEFLKRYEGSYNFGKCRIELHVCGAYSENDDMGELVADLLLVDGQGRESYAPIYFLQENSDRFHYELQNGRIMFHYKYEDRMPNPFTGGVESIHLEILSHWKDPRLKRVEFGYYLKKDYAEQNRRHRYQWAVCQEDEVAEGN